MLRQQIRAVSSLLSTMTLIGLCVGMTSTLLGLRGTMEGFSTVTIGLIMSAYFVGYLFGATRAPKTFAGLAIFVPLVLSRPRLRGSTWCKPFWDRPRGLVRYAFR